MNKNKIKIIIAIIIVALLGVGMYLILNKNEDTDQIDSYIKYTFVNESDYNIELNNYDSSKLESVEYYYDSCLDKEMPTVTFEIENNKLAIKNYYDDTYYLNVDYDIKEFVIRTFQSNEEMYLLILNEKGEVFASNLWGIGDTGCETALTPKQIEKNLTKINIDDKVISIGKTIGLNVSLVSLNTSNDRYLLSLD